MHRYTPLFLLLVLVSTTEMTFSQTLPSVPNVYLDCSSCDVSYIRTNITFVNYVRDQDDASVYLQITDLRTGSGGREFTLVFNGSDEFAGRSDTLRYVSLGTDTGDERRIGLNRYIKIGLLPFASSTVAVRNLDIFYEEPELSVQGEEEAEDPWNGWVFDINMNSWLNGESTERNLGLYGGLFAERITPVWKIRTRVRGEINRRRVELSDGPSTSNRDWGEYWGLYGYSISDHASLGVYTKINFARNSNIQVNMEASPTFEYNFFPYEQYQERRFLIRYRVTPAFRKYIETTVLGVDEEFLLHQNLYALLRYDRPWGRINISVSGSNYFHNLDLNRLVFNPSLNIRIIRGLSVNFSGRYRIINDQISLPAEEQSEDCYALGNCQRPTSYDYRISFGLSYTFGSMYNNVVNPRF